MTANTLCRCGHSQSAHWYDRGQHWDCGTTVNMQTGETCDCESFRLAPNPHAVALGKLGGLAGKGKSTERQRIASQANVAKARAVMAAKRAAQKEETK